MVHCCSFAALKSLSKNKNATNCLATNLLMFALHKATRLSSLQVPILVAGRTLFGT